MSGYARLTQEQKLAFHDMFNECGVSYELEKSDKLNEVFNQASKTLNDIPESGNYVLISKPEVHGQVWYALCDANIGKLQSFDNGDPEEAYRKARKVDVNLLEAFIAMIVAIMKFLTRSLAGGPGGEGTHDGTDGNSHNAGRQPRLRHETGYER